MINSFTITIITSSYINCTVINNSQLMNCSFYIDMILLAKFLNSVKEVCTSVWKCVRKCKSFGY